MDAEIYIQNGHNLKPKLLEKSVYETALKSLILVCADVAMICQKRKYLYLAKRKVYPMPDYWTIGGRRFAGDEPSHSACRNLKRETSLDVDPTRFRKVFAAEVIWSKGKETSKSCGQHDIIQFFRLDVTDEELVIAKSNLDEDEYVGGSLRGFNKDQLIAQEINPIMVRLYETLFED